MFSWSVCVGGGRRSGGNKVGGLGGATNCTGEVTLLILMVKVKVFPNPNLTFRTNLIFVTSSWNNDEFFTSWFLFLNLQSFASLSASPGNSQCWVLSIGSQGSHMTNWFLQKLYSMGTNWYMGMWTVRPSNSISHVETTISTDGNTLNGGS